MKITRDQLYYNLEALTKSFEAQGMLNARPRLNSIALMIHEIKVVEKFRGKSLSDIRNNQRYNRRFDNCKTRMWNIRYNHLRKLKSLVCYIDHYLLVTTKIVDKRLDKLPNLEDENFKFSKKSNRQYIDKVVRHSLGKRRFKIQFSG